MFSFFDKFNLVSSRSNNSSKAPHFLIVYLFPPLNCDLQVRDWVITLCISVPQAPALAYRRSSNVLLNETSKKSLFSTWGVAITRVPNKMAKKHVFFFYPLLPSFLKSFQLSKFKLTDPSSPFDVKYPTVQNNLALSIERATWHFPNYKWIYPLTQKECSLYTLVRG